MVVVNMGEKMEKEEMILQKRFLELAERSYDKNIFTYTEFLDLAGQNIFFMIEDKIRHAGVTFFGGNEECDRKILRFGKKEDIGYEEKFPISCILIEPLVEKFGENLSHRDYLGALMNLGIERSMLGDIFIRDKKAYIFCMDKMSSFIMEELSKVRHTNVKCSLVDEIKDFLKSEKERRVILSPSERIDVVVAKLYHLSRSSSLDLFRTKKIYVNGKLCENNSYSLKGKDIISIRGYGKFQYAGISHETKKGKLSLLTDIYI